MAMLTPKVVMIRAHTPGRVSISKWAASCMVNCANKLRAATVSSVLRDKVHVPNSPNGSVDRGQPLHVQYNCEEQKMDN